MVLNLRPDAQPEAEQPRTLDDHQAPELVATVHPMPVAGAFDMNAAMAEARRLADQVEAGQLRPDTEPFTVQLQPRHAAYVRERAAAFGETPEQHLARLVLLFRQTDPWRTIDTRPAELGAPAGSGRRS